MEDIAKLYLSGMSIPQVSKETGIAISTIRFRLKKLGLLRSRGEALRLASSQGRLGHHLRGVSRVLTQDHKDAISVGRKKWANENAKGVSLKPSGYLEYTRGENKSRSVHVVLMEKHIGRRINFGECVHHVDGNKQNNELSNLRLMTISEHTRLHREQDALEGKHRDRDKNGRFS